MAWIVLKNVYSSESPNLLFSDLVRILARVYERIITHTDVAQLEARFIDWVKLLFEKLQKKALFKMHSSLL